MDTSVVIELVKARLGITSAVRDAYLAAIIDGVISELESEKGIILDRENSHHLMFVVDYSSWRYLNRDEVGAMPRHLQFRLHNLMLSSGGIVIDVQP